MKKKNKRNSSVISVFIYDKDTAKLYVQFFLDQNNLKSKCKCRNQLIYAHLHQTS